MNRTARLAVTFAACVAMLAVNALSRARAVSAPPTAALPTTAVATGAAPAPGSATRAALRFSTVEGVDGVPLNVVEAGERSKPGIILVHGIGQSYLSFENQLHSALAQEFHLVAYDLRGHGNSGKPWNREAYVDSRKWAGDLERVMTATGLKKPILLGWSYGTLVTADYLRAYGADGLAGIVLVGAYGGFMPPPAPPATATAPGKASEAGGGRPTTALDLQRMRAEQGSADLEVDIESARLVAHLLTAKTMPAAWYERATLIGMMLPAKAHAWMFDRSLANGDLILRMTVPLLVCIGGQDRNTPEAQGRDFAAKVPGARVAFFPDSGHSPFAEDAQHFNRELGEFARGALGRAGVLH